MTTKEQERKALEQIRKIVAGLGEGSYIGMAFEGCFEIAEENIENDFELSMKQRAEAAEKKVATLELDNRDLRISIQRIKAEDSTTITMLEEKVAKLQEAIIPGDDLCDFNSMVEEEIYKQEEIAESAARMIVEFADTPTDIAFTNAVREHRNAKKSVEYWTAIKARIVKARDTYNALMC